MNRTTHTPESRRMARLARLRQLAGRLGYVADGNHLFSGADHANIYLGRWRPSVIEAPHRHRASVVRLARCLARFYA